MTVLFGILRIKIKLP